MRHVMLAATPTVNAAAGQPGGHRGPVHRGGLSARTARAGNSSSSASAVSARIEGGSCARVRCPMSALVRRSLPPAEQHLQRLGRGLPTVMIQRGLPHAFRRERLVALRGGLVGIAPRPTAREPASGMRGSRAIR